MGIAFLPTLFVTGVYYLLPIVYPEKTTIHIDIKKGGHWTINGELTVRVLHAGRQMTAAIIEELIEESCGDGTEAPFYIITRGKAEYLDDNYVRIVFAGESEDVFKLTETVRDVLAIERCAFSWDRRALAIAGYSTNEYFGIPIPTLAAPDRHLVRDATADLVITTEGRITVSGFPARIDRGGQRVVVDLLPSCGPSPQNPSEWTLEINGLEQDEK